MAEDWRQVEVDLDAADVDRLSGAVWAAGAAGVEEREEDGRARLVVAVPAGAVDAVLSALGGQSVVVRSVADDEGLDAWRDYATPTRVGDVVIQPAWLARGPAAEHDIVVLLDPGRAFGSGAHATTRMALELLATAPIVGRVLDVGTGSGVLAITAARLGASYVSAVDIDAEALEAAARNTERNGVGSIVSIGREVVGTFDVVIANITAPTLTELSETLVAALHPGGRLVLSGMLQSQEAETTAAFEGVEWCDRRAEDDWVAVAGRGRR